MTLMHFFCAILLHTKVELSKIGLYYTRALEAKQNSGFPFEIKNSHIGEKR